MSKVDEELTRRLHRAERPVDADGLLEVLERRRSHRDRLRKAQAGLLAVAVLAATGVGYTVLARLFVPNGRGLVGVAPYGAQGAIVVCGDPSGGQLCRVDAEALARGATAEDLVQLTDLTGDLIAMPAVSPDATTVVFERYARQQEDPELWMIRTDGSGLRQLTTRDSGLTQPSWSPRGMIIAVDREDPPVGEPATFAIIDPAGQMNERVNTIELPGLRYPSWPQWSPDGSRILFAAGTNPPVTTATDVYTVAPDGSNLTALTDSNTVEWRPTWSPDGRSIAFSLGPPDGEEIFVCPINCSAPQSIRGPDGQPIHGNSPVWTPDGQWIAYEMKGIGRVTTIEAVHVDGSRHVTLASPAAWIAWIPSVEANSPQPSPSPEASASPDPQAEGRDIGLGFNLCHTERLRGIDFLGDGALGSAWTGTDVRANGMCPSNGEGRYGVAVDFTGDGIADGWSGETMKYCVSCTPWRAADLNGDGTEELIVVLQWGTEIEFGLYTVRSTDPGGDPQIMPFRVGEPGHEAAGFVPGEPFTFWAGGDEGRSESVYCDSLPTFWLTSISSVVDAGADALSTVNETHVQIGTDGIVHILDARTTEGRYPEDVAAPYVTTGPACGIDFNVWQ